MTRFVQMHLLTFVPSANMNRDDTGRPKTAIIGGGTRLRLSSQSLKRAWRTSDVFKTVLEGHLSERTRRFGEQIKMHLMTRGVEENKAVAITRKINEVFGKPKGEKDDHPLWTEQLSFLSPTEQKAALDLAVRMSEGEEPEGNLPAMVLKRADTAADIAMFGRMFADHPDFNREAAVQVAHAFTTHRVVVEDDYYTAVDDLNKHEEDAGAGFVGEAGFGSGVFYLYLCIEVERLIANLNGDEDLAKNSVAALVEAAATSSPSGKRASFGSHVAASYALVEKGSQQPRTLAAAFAKGVKKGNFIKTSIKKLNKTRDSFNQIYGAGDVSHYVFNAMEEEDEKKGTVKEMVAFATDWSA